MKVFLYILFLVNVQISFGFTNSFTSEPLLDSSKVDFKIQGDWYLSTTEILDGFGFIQDTNSLISNQHKNRKILFKADSVITFPIASKRFYTGSIRGYRYQIEHDSIYQADFLKILSGKKRKEKELESYEIIKCSKDELILKTTKHINDALNLTDFSIYYTYRRESVDTLLSLLKGKWYHCSHDYKTIGINMEDTTEITFVRQFNDSVCIDLINNLKLEFYRLKYNNRCSVLTYTKLVGGGYEMNFMLDPENDLLYIGGVEYIIYDILELNKNILTISLNRERTESYNKKSNTHNNK